MEDPGRDGTVPARLDTSRAAARTGVLRVFLEAVDAVAAAAAVLLGGYPATATAALKGIILVAAKVHVEIALNPLREEVSGSAATRILLQQDANLEKFEVVQRFCFN